MYKRIKIIAGHYGSGKTEFSLNYAIHRARLGKRVTLADLDIVNPYFRSREKQEMLGEEGVRVIASSVGTGINADLPALAPQLLSVFKDPVCECVVDAGGDPIGAKVLGRFNMNMSRDDYDMWIVVNANRPNTQTACAMVDSFEMIEKASRLKVSGIINNTHLVGETGANDIFRGNELCAEVAEITGIPVIYTCISNNPDITFKDKIKGTIFPLKVFLRPNWM